jgi:small subunit ribosomal protein S20
MPNIRSAIKRMRQNERRRQANRAQRSALRTSIKKIRAMIAEGNAEAAQAQLTGTLSVIGKAASKGIIPRNTASRYASRISRAVSDMKKTASAA